MTVKFSKNNLKLLSCSYSLPGPSINNDELFYSLKNLCSKTAASKAMKISKLLAIEKRHMTRNIHQQLSAPKPSAPELCSEVLQKALNQINLSINDCGYLIGHTCTPHTQVPPNISWVSEEMKYHGPYLELRQACTGFANALQISSAMLINETEPIAIVGSETGSVYFDISTKFLSTDQLINFMQMGDGAGCVILAPDDGTQSEILTDMFLGHIGIGKSPGFYLEGGSFNTHLQKGVSRFHHDAKNVRKFGPELFEKGLKVILDKGYKITDFKYIIPHQANGHIDSLLSKKFSIEKSRIINDAKNFGNLGSAAIWVSFSKLIASKKLQRGDKVLVLGAEATKYLYGGFVYIH